MTEKQHDKLDAIVLNLKKVAKELGKKNITISDCRLTGMEYSFSWASRIYGLTFNDLKKMAGLPENRKGASSYGKRGLHVSIKKTGELRPCNKCDKEFERTSLNRAICPKCSAVNAQESDHHVSLFSTGQCGPRKGRS